MNRQPEVPGANPARWPAVERSDTAGLCPPQTPHPGQGCQSEGLTQKGSPAGFAFRPMASLWDASFFGTLSGGVAAYH